jgi:hypothetical protein
MHGALVLALDDSDLVGHGINLLSRLLKSSEQEETSPPGFVLRISFDNCPEPRIGAKALEGWIRVDLRE